jgi:hypothetical protein
MKGMKHTISSKLATWTFAVDDSIPSQAPIVIEDEEERRNTTIAADFLRCHQKLAHIPEENSVQGLERHTTEAVCILSDTCVYRMHVWQIHKAAMENKIIWKF